MKVTRIISRHETLFEHYWQFIQCSCVNSFSIDRRVFKRGRRAITISIASDRFSMPINFRAHTKTTNNLIYTFLSLSIAVWGCKSVIDRQDVRPRVLRDVPARVLAYRLDADVDSPRKQVDDAGEKLEAIQKDFSTRRTNDALIRTVKSPDGLRVLALYGTDDEPTSAFRIDLYNTDGQFLRNLSPP